MINVNYYNHLVFFYRIKFYLQKFGIIFALNYSVKGSERNNKIINNSITMKKLFILVCAALATLTVSAQTEDKPWSIGVYGGKVEAANDWGNKFFHVTDNFYGAASLTFSRYLNERFDAGLQALWGRYGMDGGEFFVNDGELKSGICYVDLMGKFKFVTNEEALLHPFVFINLGTRTIHGLGESADFQTTSEDNSGFSFVLGGGLGCDLRLSDSWGIRYFAKYGYPMGSKADLADNRDCGSFNDQQLIHNLGVYVNFAFNTDKDGDGVPNKLDQCPNTPAGVSVDEYGCPLDTDKDGVADYLDKCPGTPEGVAIDSVGCPLDADKDGVADYLDQCPDTPENVSVDENGCPLDSDGDGVADYLDKCPGTPSAAKGFVTEEGCPTDKDGDEVFDFEDVCVDVAGVKENKGYPEIKAEVKKVFEKALNGIQFQTGSAKIKSVSNKILNDVVKIMNENPSYKLSINGHTDNVGDPAKNQKLSEDRAAAVKKYLEDKGIDSARLTSAGFGQDQPVESNKTANGRAKNRRVEFKVVFEK